MDAPPPNIASYHIYDKNQSEIVGQEQFIGSDAQNIVAAQYTAMFLLWKLGGLTEYKAVFLGEKRLKFVSQIEAIQDDFSHKLTVLPLFATARPRFVSAPAGVVFQQMLQDGMAISGSNPPKFDVLETLDSTCAGYTQYGFVVGWNILAPKMSKPRVEVTCSADIATPGAVAIEFDAVMFYREQDVSTIAQVKIYFKYGISSVSQPILANIEAGYKDDLLGSINIPSTIRVRLSQFTDLKGKWGTVKTMVIDFSEVFNLTGTAAITLVRVPFR